MNGVTECYSKHWYFAEYIYYGFRRSLAHDTYTIHILQCQIEIKIIVSRVENLKSNSDRIIEGQRQTVAEFGQFTSERSSSSRETLSADFDLSRSRVLPTGRDGAAHSAHLVSQPPPILWVNSTPAHLVSQAIFILLVRPCCLSSLFGRFYPST